MNTSYHNTLIKVIKFYYWGLSFILFYETELFLIWFQIVVFSTNIMHCPDRKTHTNCSIHKLYLETLLQLHNSLNINWLMCHTTSHVHLSGLPLTANASSNTSKNDQNSWILTSKRSSKNLFNHSWSSFGNFKCRKTWVIVVSFQLPKPHEKFYPGVYRFGKWQPHSQYLAFYLSLIHI